MKILAIGSEGNIGKPLVRHLRSVGHNVLEADIRPGHKDKYMMADINYPIDLLDAIQWKPEVIYLMAAVVSRVTCEQASSLSVATNLSGTNNIIQMAKRIDAKLVFFSTSEVYGPSDEVLNEYTTIPHPNNRYGLTKLLGEQLIEYEVEHYGLRAVTLRPFMVYSEEETLGDHRSAIIRFADRLSRGKEIEVHKNTYRSWLHISDAVCAIEAAAGLDQYHKINIGHPEVRSTEVIAEKIRECLGASPDLIRLLPQPDQMTPIKIPDLQNQIILLNIIPKVSIENGIERVCGRFKK